MALFLIFLCTVICQGFVSDFLTEEDRSRYLDLIVKSQSSENYLLEKSLQSTIYGLEALNLLGGEYPNQNELCKALSKMKPKKEEIYQQLQWLSIVGKLNCGVNIPSQVPDKLQSTVNKSRLSNLVSAYYAAQALIQSEKLTENDVNFEKISSILMDLIGDDGLVRENPKETTGSPYKTALSLQLLSNLYQTNPELVSDEVVSAFTDALTPLIAQGKKTSGGMVFQNSPTATVSVIAGICEFVKTFNVDTSIDTTTMNRFGKYVLNNKYAETVSSARNILVGVHHLGTNSIAEPLAVSVKNPNINLSIDDGKRFSVALMSLNGNPIEADKLEIVGFSFNNSPLQIPEFSRPDDGSYVLNLRELATETGIFRIEVDLVHGDENASIKREIRVVNELTEIKAVWFDFSKRLGLSKVDDSDKNRLTYKKTHSQALSLTPQREVRLEVLAKGAPLSQVAAIFTKEGECETGMACTFTVAGTKKSRKWQFKIDSLKSDYSLFEEGFYTVTLVLGGIYVAEPLRWDIGRIDVALDVEDDDDKDYEPVDDLKVYYAPRPEIQHTFADPPNMANSFISLVFTGIVGFPLLAFVVLHRKFFGSFESDIDSNGYLFLLSLLAFVVLMCCYWLFLNLFQATACLVPVSIAVIGLGFNSLKSISLRGGLMNQ